MYLFLHPRSHSFLCSLVLIHFHWTMYSFLHAFKCLCIYLDVSVYYMLIKLLIYACRCVYIYLWILHFFHFCVYIFSGYGSETLVSRWATVLITAPIIDAFVGTGTGELFSPFLLAEQSPCSLFPPWWCLGSTSGPASHQPNKLGL
jgi:hypothetical protein